MRACQHTLGRQATEAKSIGRCGNLSQNGCEIIIPLSESAGNIFISNLYDNLFFMFLGGTRELARASKVGGGA